MDKFAYGKLHKLKFGKDVYYFRSLTLNEIKFVLRISPEKVQSEPAILAELVSRCIVIPNDVTVEMLEKELAPVAFQIFDKLINEISFLFDDKEFKKKILDLRLIVKEQGELFSNFIQILTEVFGYSPLDINEMSIEDVLKQVIIAEQILKQDLFFDNRKMKGKNKPSPVQLDPIQQKALLEAEQSLRDALLEVELQKQKAIKNGSRN